jgi:hypothetical protein
MIKCKSQTTLGNGGTGTQLIPRAAVSTHADRHGGERSEDRLHDRAGRRWPDRAQRGGINGGCTEMITA